MRFFAPLAVTLAASAASAAVHDSQPPSQAFLGDAAPVLLVRDKVFHPTIPRRFHYRVQARADPDPDSDEPAKHIHVDLEARYRDDTVELNHAKCELEVEEDGTGYFIAAVGNEVDLAHAAVAVAECENLAGETVYGKVMAVQLAEKQSRTDGVDAAAAVQWYQVKVNTTFADEFDKMNHAFEGYRLQQYAGPTPIQTAHHLPYIQSLKKNPARFYDALTEVYGRPQIPMLRPDAQLAKHLRTGEGEGERRRLDREEASVDATPLFNCEEVSLDSSSPGCAEFSSEKLALMENLQIPYDGTDYDISLYCVECALTVEGASIYSDVDSDFDFSDLVDDLTDAVDSVVDGVSDGVDDAVDTGSEIVEDVVDTGGDVIDDAEDVVDDIFGGWRGRRQLQTAEISFAFGGNLDGMVLDFALLMEILMTPNEDSDIADTYTLFTIYVPNLGIGSTVLGIDVGAGLRFQSYVDPLVSLEGGISAQAGAKLQFDGDFAFEGTADLDGLEVNDLDGNFHVTKWLDTPRITATVGGKFELVFILEMQVGLWASISDSTNTASAGASIYGAIGVPLVIEGMIRGTAPGLHTSIPDSFCVTDYDTSTNFFIGDCTQPNNLQAQVAIYTTDIYGRVYAGASFTATVAGVEVGSASMSYEYGIEQSSLTSFDLTAGPYNITYCDCILYDGVDCTEQDSGSQCATDSFPPASERYAPAYTEDSPESGMALAWDQEEIGVIDEQDDNLLWIIIGCSVGGVVLIALIVGLAVGLKAKKKTKANGRVARTAKAFGGQKKRNTKASSKYAVTSTH